MNIKPVDDIKMCKLAKLSNMSSSFPYQKSRYHLASIVRMFFHIFDSRKFPIEENTLLSILIVLDYDSRRKQHVNKTNTTSIIMNKFD